MSKALFRMYWVERKDVSLKATLIDAVKRSGITGMDAVLQAIDVGSFEGAEQRRQLETATDEAVQRGTPGVPGFWVPEEIWKVTGKASVERAGFTWARIGCSLLRLCCTP